VVYFSLNNNLCISANSLYFIFLHLIQNNFILVIAISLLVLAIMRQLLVNLYAFILTLFFIFFEMTFLLILLLL